ncbi:hypothetical protein [Proteus hauseri]|nr:hypothetical protein [Proteus hauseri]
MHANTYFMFLGALFSTGTAITFPHTPIIAYNETFGLRISAWILSILSIVMIGYSLWKYRAAVFTSGSHLLLAGCGVTIIAEILNRFAFL